jgi:thiosulfate dehydrogenase [quinone] large subunit
MNKEKLTLVVLRVVMGFIFLWAFLDKVFGLGFSTTADKAWIHGGSPTYGFLTMATKGPLVNVFHQIATMPYIDWVFMLGLLFVGLTLIIGKFVKWGAWVGIVMLALMYLSLLWPATNPVIDEHIVYILVLLLFAFAG